MTPLIPLTQDLVLVGGGHAHALVLRMWGMKPMAGVRLTVINPGPTAPYTGMLPGFVAGHYNRDDLEIDLVRLCRFANARLVLAKAVGIDRQRKVITVTDRPEIGYDVASVDVGIHTGMPDLPGFAEHGLAAKPLDVFARGWTRFVKSVQAGTQKPEAAVIGGGIGGAELAMAMSHRLHAVTATPAATPTATPTVKPTVTLIEAASTLTGVSPAARAKLTRALTAQGIQLRVNTTIQQVKADRIVTTNDEIPAALTVGAAGARPHDWLSTTDLPLVDGYIKVDETLATVDDPDVFAAGDCAHLGASPRPKAGVFAVRAAPILLHNLRARLAGTDPKPFHPQKTYLKLISLGGKSAIAEKGALSFQADLMWVWKDRIDRKFMDKFRSLPTMPAPPLPADRALGVAQVLADKPLCGGCGAKIGPGVLHDTLCDLAAPGRSDVLTAAGDDAAVLKIGGRKQVVSVDHLRAFDDDYWRMARIATVHALGDIWAMGAAPQSVLVSLILPRMTSALQKRTLSEIMDGVQSISTAAGAAIVGGHSSLGAELTIGLTVTGLMDKNRDAITIAGAQPGDALILTRPIGSGTLLAAEMAGAANGQDIANMLAQMQRPQATAAQILSKAHAMTDVTGFGLGGHLAAICKASDVGARLTLDAIATYDGALALSQQGHHSSILQDNLTAAKIFDGLDGPKGKLLFDPQTAGGLLASVAPEQAEDLHTALTKAGYSAAIIGTVTDHSGRILCT